MGIFERQELAGRVAQLKASGQRVVFTNGCFDILHAGHVTLLEQARQQGDYLIVGLNSDASVKRLKGPTRPVHDEWARATVLAALGAVDAVVIFPEDTPVETLEVLRPPMHVKGGDYVADQLPEAATVRAYGGEIVILPLVEGYSTTAALAKAKSAPAPAIIMIPARFGSTRFPGKPLVDLEGQTVIERVVRASLDAATGQPVVVATDDERIAGVVREKFGPEQAVAVMTSPNCHTGTDRLAEATLQVLGQPQERAIVVNVQGDEPFVETEHLAVLIGRMRREPQLKMATLATPLPDPRMQTDPNVVKVVVSGQGKALYFSRATIPHVRDADTGPYLRHLGLYAYDARWLLEMTRLPPSPLEELEKLEQLRALEHGVDIGVEIVENVVPIAIDTPADLERARQYLRSLSAA